VYWITFFATPVGCEKMGSVLRCLMRLRFRSKPAELWRFMDFDIGGGWNLMLASFVSWLRCWKNVVVHLL
jgi:hypothetical protein